jgi:hypothetical protein
MLAVQHYDQNCNPTGHRGSDALCRTAYASEPVHHELNFGYKGENQNVEILNWQYGNSKLAFTHASKEWLATGHIPQSWNATGTFPVADSLYVKWRVKSTGKVYEDTVDLKSRLPSNMNDKIVHFLVKDSRLYVYLIEGYYNYHASEASDCPVTAVYKPFKCTELYPEHWKNF